MPSEERYYEWWIIRTKYGKVCQEFSFDLHSEPFPPAVEFFKVGNPYKREPGYYAVQRNVDAKDGEYPLGPFEKVDEARKAALE